MPAPPSGRRAQDLGPEGIPLLEFVPLGIVEGVRGRAETDHRLAGIHVSSNVRDLLSGELAPAQVEDSQISSRERLQAGNIALRVLVRKGFQNCGLESISFFQFLGQSRQSALRAIFMVSDDEDNMRHFPGVLLRQREAERGKSGPKLQPAVEPLSKFASRFSPEPCFHVSTNMSSTLSGRYIHKVLAEALASQSPDDRFCARVLAVKASRT